MDTQEQQGLNYSDNGNSRSFLKVTLGRDITKLKQDMVERTPKWEGKEEQKKMMKPVARVGEAKENVIVKPPPRLEGIKKTTVKTVTVVQGNKEKTAVRPASGVEEAKEKAIVKPLPRVEGAKEKTTVKPSSGVKEAHENNVSKDQTKPKEPPAPVKTVTSVPRAAAVTEKKKLRAADFKSEPRWDFEDKYLLDNSPPPSLRRISKLVGLNSLVYADAAGTQRGRPLGRHKKYQALGSTKYSLSRKGMSLSLDVECAASEMMPT
ncbi:hypothetical protein llap_20738 [Limosa lapponica baueri]|uniref:Uncharacterized protein n=1 Tax=Limosa lapponica baueri TaxID=1758121 RepID=A0A2I0T5A9_LIMLA|nr:hypothetical protein llap_20738 [Limosa lapponica baueri]